MNKVSIIKGIVKGYFVAALAGSFTHIVDAAGKTGLHGWEMWATPFMIDGLAVIGMIMRGTEFSKKTRQLGAWTQGLMGSFSLTANVYAAETTGGVIFGVGIVALFLAAEWLSDNIESVEVDRQAAAEAKAEAKRAANRVSAAKRRAKAKATAPKTPAKGAGRRLAAVR